VLKRIGEQQRGDFDLAEWEKMDRAGQVDAIQSIVERVGYDGVTRQICIRFHSFATAVKAGEVRA
jgi:Zn-dependent M32 family carboxypeptidase